MKVYFVTKKNIFISIIILFIFIMLGLWAVKYSGTVSNVFNSNKDIPIYSVDVQEKKVAITFDCAWRSDDINQIVNILNENNAKATFFLVGDWIDKNKDAVKLLHSSGQEIANHSDKHLDMTRIKEDKIKSEIENANKKIEDITGKKGNLFRAPYGAYNSMVMQSAKSLGQHVIQWDCDSLDWKELGVQPIIDRVNKYVQNGSIILLHNDTKYTVEALPMILTELKNKGYQFVTISDLIYKENYYIDHKGRQHNLIQNKASID